MDRIVEAIVRLIAAIAGRARFIPGINYAEHVPGTPLKILLVGYNGARPLLGIAPVNPFCWPVKPSLMHWSVAFVRNR